MNYPRFSKENRSLLKKHLNIKIFNHLKTKRTKSGFTLFHAIQSGVVNQDSSIGIYAGNAEAYNIFAEIFNPIISDYHSFNPENFHKSCLSVDLKLTDPDPKNRYIRSTRIRAARNIRGFDFMPFISSRSRKEIELKAVQALEQLKTTDKNLKGRYMPIKNISESEQIYLKKKHFLFSGKDRFQNAAGIERDWPESRGIFLSDDEKSIVWVNEEDHLRIISMEKGGKISEAFNRLCIFLTALEKNIVFSFDPHLGFLTSCPTNIGTGIRAGVHIKLPALNENKELLFKLTDSFNLQIRGTRGEKTGVKNSVFDISNSQRLGITEKQCIQNLHKGLSEIIALEKQLAKNP